MNSWTLNVIGQLAKKTWESFVFKKMLWVQDKKSSPKCPGLSSCTEKNVKLMLQYILRLQEEIHEKEKKFESLKEYPQWHWSENDI